MGKKHLLTFILFLSLFSFLNVQTSSAFWIWTPKDKKPVDPQKAAKDTPEEQFEWAMRFFENKEFKRAAEEFVRLTDEYKDSELAPESQYYAGRAFEEEGKYLFAYQNYQKTIDNYPYTKRLEEIIEREYNIAGIFQDKNAPKLIELELSVSIDRAIEIYKKIIENNAYGPYADKSVFKMAECYRRIKKYSEALDAYDKLVTDYPKSELVDEARYQLAYTAYESSLDSEYDQASTDRALNKFEKLAGSTNVAAVSNGADKAMSLLREKKADSIYNTAAFYEKQKKYKSAVIYYQDIVDQYPETAIAGMAGEKIKLLKEKASK